MLTAADADGPSLPRTLSCWIRNELRLVFAVDHGQSFADFGSFCVNRFRSRRALEAEITLLRHQLNVSRRKSPNRIRLTRFDRFVFTLLYRISPKVLSAIQIVRPETVIRWRRMGFKVLWRWKSLRRGGRLNVSKGTGELIREMSFANILWGASHIHGELKADFAID